MRTYVHTYYTFGRSLVFTLFRVSAVLGYDYCVGISNNNGPHKSYTHDAGRYYAHGCTGFTFLSTSISFGGRYYDYYTLCDGRLYGPEAQSLCDYSHLHMCVTTVHGVRGVPITPSSAH